MGIEARLTAIAASKGTAAQILKDAGVTGQNLAEAVKELRGGHKVNSQSSEDTYQALSKYARNLVEAARQGKLDPVIGRDEGDTQGAADTFATHQEQPYTYW